MKCLSRILIFCILTAHVYLSENQNHKESNMNYELSNNNNSKPIFKPYENVFVINLNSRPDKLEYMTDILNEIEQPFTRIEAVNGRESLEKCKENPISFHSQIVYTCNDFLTDAKNNRCLDGEIGCWLSHLKVYFQIEENFKNTGKDNPTVILEDDIDLDINFKTILNIDLSLLPPDWEVFYPGYNYAVRIQKVNNNFVTSPYFSGAFAYVVRNAEVARKLISFSNLTTCQIADFLNLYAIRRGELNAYLAHPFRYASHNNELKQDIELPIIKTYPSSLYRLTKSTLQMIKTRKEKESKLTISPDPIFKPLENVYVINLNSRPDRLAFMTEILNEIQQPFTRIEAFNGNELLAKCKEKSFSFHPKIVYSCRELIRDNERKKCLIGEIGCWLSHLKVYFQIVENFENTGRDNPTLILEDDVDLDIHFKTLVNNTLLNLPSDWEIFYTGCFVPNNIDKINDEIAIVNNFYGAFAYIVRNAEVAKKLIALANKKTCLVTDHFNLNAIKRKELNVYHAYPQQYASFNVDLRQDIDHLHIKNSTDWSEKLKESAHEKIKKRKDDL